MGQLALQKPAGNLRHLKGVRPPGRLDSCSSHLKAHSSITKQPFRRGRSAHQLPSSSEQIPFSRWDEGQDMEEVKGPVVAGHLSLGDDHESRLGLEVLVRPGGEKSNV